MCKKSEPGIEGIINKAKRVEILFQEFLYNKELLFGGIQGEYGREEGGGVCIIHGSIL